MSATTVASGLVEIAALTALVGSSTAESLTLGSRGAAGLPWAAISSFGAIHVLKACVAAFTPSWLRDSIGVRNDRSDAAVGLSLDLWRKGLGKTRAADAVGVTYTAEQNTRSAEGLAVVANPTGVAAGSEMKDVYIFDSYTSMPLRACATTEKDQAVPAYVYVRDLHWASHNASRARLDFFGLLLSSVKLAESTTLWYYGADHLWWITSVIWIYFFVAGLMLQVLGIAREYAGDTKESRVDILAGKLPTPQIAGEHRKVLLDAPRNVRASPVWKAVWTVGGCISAASLVATYMQLGANKSLIVYMWTAFQILWLVLRSVYFYFSEDTDTIMQAVTAAVEHKTAPPEYRSRLLGLVSAVSRYQILNHPRGHWAYEDDMQIPWAIELMLKSADGGIQTTLPMPGLPLTANGQELSIEVLAVIGDTLLSSATWFCGMSTKWHGMTVYDSCLIAIRIGDKTSLVAAARILSGPPKTLPRDVENPAGSIFVPRGGSNDGQNIVWAYWIPLEGEHWLHLRSNKQHIKGKRLAKVLTGAQVTQQLEKGDFMISLTHEKEIREIAHASACAGKCLLDLVVP